MNKVFSVIAVACFLLSSCSPSYIQVLSVKQAPDSETEVKDFNGTLVYEDSNCNIEYNMWSKGGRLDFVFRNITDNDLFLVMGKSFLIKNGHAYDYNAEQLLSYNESNESNVGIHTSVVIDDGTETVDVVVPVNGVICIPARSYKIIKGFPIYSGHIKLCEDNKNNYPRKESAHTYYTQENSPLVFENRICYSTDETLTDLKKVNTTFYISEFVNYRFEQNVAFDYYKYNECGKKVYSYDANIIVGGGANQFYYIYQ